MSKSHTNKATASASELRLVPGLGLIDLAKPDLPASLVDKLDGELELFAARMHEGLMAAALAVGLEVFAELLEANVVEVAGPKGKHNAGRSAVRHGREPAKVPLGGRMVQVAKPRVRRADGTGEVPLEAWAALSSRDLLNEHTVASMLTGVSSRHYATTLEPAGESIGEASSSTSHSAVSRRFVAATRKGLAAFRSRPLDSRRFLVCYIDGFVRHEASRDRVRVTETLASGLSQQPGETGGSPTLGTQGRAGSSSANGKNSAKPSSVISTHQRYPARPAYARIVPSRPLTDQLLLLGVNRDHRLAATLEPLRRLSRQVLKLRGGGPPPEVPIGHRQESYQQLLKEEGPPDEERRRIGREAGR